MSSEPACVKKRRRRRARSIVSGRALSYYAEGVDPVPTNELRINQS